jgi:hypothetical protein
MMQEIIWSEDAPAKSEASVYSPLRQPNDLSLGDTTSFWSAKNNRLILMESDLERITCEACETSDEVTLYCEQPIIIPYFFEGRERSYYPDLLVRFSNGKEALVEVKDRFGMPLYITLCKGLAALKWAREKGMGYGIFSPRGQSYRSFMQTPLEGEWTRELLQAIDQNCVLNFAQVKQILDKHPKIQSDHLLAFTVQNDLMMNRAPFKLGRLPAGISFKPLASEEPR